MFLYKILVERFPASSNEITWSDFARRLKSEEFWFDCLMTELHISDSSEVSVELKSRYSQYLVNLLDIKSNFVQETIPKSKLKEIAKSCFKQANNHV